MGSWRVEGGTVNLRFGCRVKGRAALGGRGFGFRGSGFRFWGNLGSRVWGRIGARISHIPVSTRNRHPLRFLRRERNHEQHKPSSSATIANRRVTPIVRMITITKKIIIATINIIIIITVIIIIIIITILAQQQSSKS